MKEKTDCHIIQDLLPNYIERLTSEETNQYIEQHTRDCEVCSKIANDMRKDYGTDQIKREKREVKYIKKYNNKIKILKIILAVILMIFVITMTRKVFIISDLSQKANQYMNSSNYHKIIYSYEQDTYNKTDIYILGDKKAVIMTKIVDGNQTITKMYSHGDKSSNIYIETKDKKIAKINQQTQMSINLTTSTYTENFLQLLLAAIPASIRTSECNGKECYYVANFASPYMLCQDGTYIDKETGLTIRTISTQIKNYDNSKVNMPAVDYVYEFNKVTEADFIEPDISQYVVE